MKIAPTIVVDTREQAAWTFPNLPTTPGRLDTGDYSVKGLTHLIAVERKSLPDLLTCVGRDRDRFRRELQRLKAYRFRMLVVECGAADLHRGDWRSRLRPAHVLGSLAAWTAQYGLPVWLGGDRESAAAFVERFLCQAARCVALENAAMAIEHTDNPVETAIGDKTHWTSATVG